MSLATQEKQHSRSVAYISSPSNTSRRLSLPQREASKQMATALNIGVNVASHAYLESKVVKESRVLIADLFRHFYSLGRVSGTSGLYHHSGNGSILSAPSPNPYPYKSLKCSNCAPLFMKVRGAMSAPLKSGLKSSSHNSEPLPRCILLDIEGTTTPITFVFDVLFPYARDNVGKHLSATYETEDTRADIKLLRSQVEDDLAQGVKGAVPIPPDDAGKDAVIAALVANIEAMIKADRKITALKQLQGHIWRTGFQNNELKGVVYDDVPEALKSWHALGIKMYIYSSGSRLAQRLIFGNTTAGDLRQFLSGFFDTNVGTKRESSSYIQISESLGVDNPSEILFLTDVVQEAVAAKAAGLKVVISVRPGNAPLPENHGFETINSFLEV